MSETKDQVIEGLISIIITQEKELAELKEKLYRVKQYLEVYEDYIKGE